MTHDIYIYEEAKGKASGIRIPWLPEKIEVDTGDLRAAEYDILDQGPVDVPNGSNLGEITFQSIFPGTARKGLPFLRGSLKKPDVYTKQMDQWKEKGTELRILVTGTRINYPVYLTKFSYSHSGGYGDVEYSLTVKTRREVKITTVKAATAKKNQTKKTSNASTATTYTIKKGDTLWGISVKYLGKGSRWKEIYNLNKAIIEETAKKHGKKSSNSGHWIYPGCKIKLPKK